jgi:lipoate-protein ligase A
MKYCDLTLPSPEENLACDEVLVDLCESGTGDEVLRVWEPDRYFVVLGYANKAETEVNLPFCRQNLIPVRRRCSGGGTVLQGPGVLNYSLVLRLDSAGPCQSVGSTNRYILQRHQEVLAALVGTRVQRQGQTDLTIGGIKFCGNAQRRHSHALLFHGSFLLDLNLDLVEKALPMPSRQPDYRLDRSHSDFLMNLKLPARKLKEALAEGWNASESLAVTPTERIQILARQKYGLDEWSFRF